MPDNKHILYEAYKKLIRDTAKTPEEYERRVRALAKELKI